MIVDRILPLKHSLRTGRKKDLIFNVILATCVILGTCHCLDQAHLECEIPSLFNA